MKFARLAALAATVTMSVTLAGAAVAAPAGPAVSVGATAVPTVGSLKTRVIAPRTLTSTYGESAVLSVKLTGTDPYGYGPSGRLRVYSGHSVIGEGYAFDGSDDIYLAGSITPGTRMITVVYFGDSDFAPARTTSTQFTINREDPSLSVSTYNFASRTSPPEVSFAMYGNHLADPSGRVFIKEGNRTLAIVRATGSYTTVRLPRLSRGLHYLSVEYTGDYRFLPAKKLTTLNVYDW